MRRALHFLAFLSACAPELPAAPIPYSLEYAIASPSTARQTGNAFGHSVAIDASFLALGSPYDDTGGMDSGVVCVHDAGSGVLLHRLANPAPFPESHFGAAVALSGTRLVVGVPQDDTGENDAGIAYVYDLSAPDPAASVLILENPNPGENDAFGGAVAIDGSRVVVGVPEGDSGALDAGCAYVYDLASATPAVPVLQLHNPDPGGDDFGVSVAIAGPRLVVGAVPAVTSADTCRVYIYDLDGSQAGTPVAVLADPTPATNDHFGISVDISGTVVAVGSPLDDTGAQNAGACHVYDVSVPALPVQMAMVSNPAPAPNDSFGGSVAVDGERLVVGASLDDNGGTDTGRVHVFDLGSDPPLPVLSIDNPSPANNDFFGRSVAVHGNRMATGAHGDNTTAADAGIGYLFDLAAGSPAVPVQILHPASPSSDEEFGTSVALEGTLIASGAPHDDKGATNAGCVYLHDLASATPQIPLLTLDNPQPGQNDYFGAAVALSGDLVITSAVQDDFSSASNSGTVYVFDLSSPTPSEPRWTIPNPSPQTGDAFGNALAVSGSLLVVAAAENDSAAMNAGSVYVYDLSSLAPTVPFLTLDNPEPGMDDGFGGAVAISGTRIVVAAHGDDAGAADAGSVYVYDLSAPAPATPVAVLRNPEPDAEDGFGQAVGISGARVVAGCPLDDTLRRDAGSVYVFDLESVSPETPAMVLVHPGAEPEDYFGIAVAISGTRVAVGASEADAGITDSGAVFVFELNSAEPGEPSDVLEHQDKKTGDRFGRALALDGANVLAGAPGRDGNTDNRGAVFYFDPDPPSPVIQVEQPPGTGLVSGQAGIHFGDTATGAGGNVALVAIRNTGTAVLELSSVLLAGGSTGDFSLEVPDLPLVLQVDQSVSFGVEFAPLSPGSRVATLRIAGNAPGAPFEVTLTGQALSAAEDTDGDGLNDVVELGLESLGFDWQVNDEELVAVLRAGANASGRYSLEQLGAVHGGLPLLPRDPASGDFALTVTLKRSATLADFVLQPLSPLHVTITPSGTAELELEVDEPRSFFRLEPR